MRIIVCGAPSTAAELAERLRLAHIHRTDEVHGDAFVLDGAPRDVAEARALDAFLRSRGTEVDAVLVVRDAVVDDEVLQHYFGRVIELDPVDPFESALERLREVLLAA